MSGEFLADATERIRKNQGTVQTKPANCAMSKSTAHHPTFGCRICRQFGPGAVSGDLGGEPKRKCGIFDEAWAAGQLNPPFNDLPLPWSKPIEIVRSACYPDAKRKRVRRANCARRRVNYGSAVSSHNQISLSVIKGLNRAIGAFAVESGVYSELFWR
jgi:hypothetical protein